MIKKAVLPAAGLGTRFLPASKATPKEMLPIIDKPLIQYAVEEAFNVGIDEIIFITSSEKYSIKKHFDKNIELESKLKKIGKEEILQKIESAEHECSLHWLSTPMVGFYLEQLSSTCREKKCKRHYL